MGGRSCFITNGAFGDTLLHSINYMLHTENYTPHIAHFRLHTAHCTLLTAHCSLHTAHCKLQAAPLDIESEEGFFLLDPMNEIHVSPGAVLR